MLPESEVGSAVCVSYITGHSHFVLDMLRNIRVERHIDKYVEQYSGAFVVLRDTGMA